MELSEDDESRIHNAHSHVKSAILKLGYLDDEALASSGDLPRVYSYLQQARDLLSSILKQAQEGKKSETNPPL